jgi:hypothetical protein
MASDLVTRPAGYSAVLDARGDDRYTHRVCVRQADGATILTQIANSGITMPMEKVAALSNPNYNIYCATVDAEWTEDPTTIYLVGQYQRDPCELDIQGVMHTSHVREAVWKDSVTGYRICNTAGDLFRNALERNRAYGRLELTKCFPTFDLSWALFCQCDHVNSQEVKKALRINGVKNVALDAPAKSLYLADIRGVWNASPRPHVQVTYSFEFALHDGSTHFGHQRRPADMGGRYKDSAGKFHAATECADGTTLGGLCFLNGTNGQLLGGGLTDGPAFLTFNVCDEFDFNLLNIFAAK